MSGGTRREERYGENKLHLWTKTANPQSARQTSSVDLYTSYTSNWNMRLSSYRNVLTAAAL